MKMISAFSPEAYLWDDNASNTIRVEKKVQRKRLKFGANLALY